MVRAEETVAPPSRPPEVTVLVVVATLQGLVLIGLGWLIIASASEPEVLDAVGRAEVAVVLGGTLLVIGVVRMLLGLMLLGGREVARSIMGVLAVAQVAFTVYALVALRTVAIVRIVGVVVAIGELWLLYGSQRSRQFFVR